MYSIQFKIKLYIPATKANSAPPIGPILGQYRLNLIEFCKDFNEQTIDWDDSVVLPVLIVGYTNSNLEYIIKSPTTTHFVRMVLGTDYLTSSPKHIKICTVQQIYELVAVKYFDTVDSGHMYQNIRTVCSTLQTMNIRIIR